jgi:hypothetical protein
MRSLRFALALVGVSLLVTRGSAAIVAEVEPNDTILTAQNIDGDFTLDFSPDIGNTTINTSTLIPHVTIDGTPVDDSTVDFYSFTVTTAGSRGIFDIDFADFDSWIELYTGAGALLAFNDDALDANWGQTGSTTTLDSYLEYVFASPGDYVIAVGNFPDLGPIASEADYTLQVSVGPDPTVVPEPTALVVWAFLGIAATLAVLFKPRSRKEQCARVIVS